MWTSKRDLFLALAVGASVAGSSGGGGGPEPGSLNGTWGATKAELVDSSSPSTKVELVAAGGSVSLALAESGSWALTVSPADQATRQLTGTWSTSGEVLTLAFAPPMQGEMQFDMTLSGTTLILEGGHVPYDVNSDGVVEGAILNMILVRLP